ncbi:hypothetical protein RRG08_054599 [Elysia crispata]|uniref:Uncharacterized protein n=1 Tax=Elysia crispata TaxID=231223 RepID=A0AAE1B2A0_9GAST|nr:hypothetical protein RRG08_054599 [Elysia crispata]
MRRVRLIALPPHALSQLSFRLPSPLPVVNVGGDRRGIIDQAADVAVLVDFNLNDELLGRDKMVDILSSLTQLYLRARPMLSECCADRASPEGKASKTEHLLALPNLINPHLDSLGDRAAQSWMARGSSKTGRQQRTRFHGQRLQDTSLLE